MTTEGSTTTDRAPIQRTEFRPDDLDDEALTDVGLAELFAKCNGGQLIYDGARWLVWDGTRWAPDATGDVERRAMAMLDGLLAFVDSQPLKNQSLRKKVVSLQSRTRLTNILAVAASSETLRRRPEELDADPTLLNFTNGTLNLDTFELLPHRPDDLITVRIEHPYHPDAEAQRWRGFQREVTAGDDALARYKQKAYGAALLGTLREQKLFFLHGNGANGKSVELDVLNRLLGASAATVPGSMFMKSSRHDATNTFARLRGVRFAIASELDEDQRLAEGVIKSMTGGEEITAKLLYKDEFTFHPMATLFIATNHLPRANKSDYAIRRRLIAIPFPATFAPEVQDPTLKKTLLAEAPGILAWLVAGARLYLAEGLASVPAVQEATDRFWNHADSVGAFLKRDTAPFPGARVGAQDMYSAYVGFCTRNGLEPVTPTAFGTRLGHEGFSESTGRRTKDSAGRKVYRGLSVSHPTPANVH